MSITPNERRIIENAIIGTPAAVGLAMFIGGAIQDFGYSTEVTAAHDMKANAVEQFEAKYPNIDLDPNQSAADEGVRIRGALGEGPFSLADQSKLRNLAQAGQDYEAQRRTASELEANAYRRHSEGWGKAMEGGALITLSAGMLGSRAYFRNYPPKR
jgi:hypothetical protein